MRRLLAAPVLLATAIAVASSLTLLSVRFAHDGDPMGQFLVGERNRAAFERRGLDVSAPAPGSGYDGQFYLRLALRPWPDRDSADGLDLPQYRSRHILWPALAHSLALGDPIRSVWALHLLQVLFVALGAVALAAWARSCGTSPFWGLLFPLQLGVVISVWRSVGDAIFAALVVATLVAWQRRSTLLAASGCILPLAWWLLVAWRLPADTAGSPWVNFSLPGVGLWEAIADAATRQTDLLRHAKDASFLGVHVLAVAAGLAFGARAGRSYARSRTLDVPALVAALFAALGLVLSSAVWVEPWAYARVLLPLPILLLMATLAERPSRWPPGWIVLGRLPAVALAVLGPAYAVALALLGRP